MSLEAQSIIGAIGFIAVCITIAQLIIAKEQRKADKELSEAIKQDVFKSKVLDNQRSMNILNEIYERN